MKQGNGASALLMVSDRNWGSVKNFEATKPKGGRIPVDDEQRRASSHGMVTRSFGQKQRFIYLIYHFSLDPFSSKGSMSEGGECEAPKGCWVRVWICLMCCGWIYCIQTLLLCSPSPMSLLLLPFIFYDLERAFSKFTLYSVLIRP